MGRFLCKALLLLLPLLLMVVSINYFGDPARLFDSDYEKQVSEILLNDNFVTNIANFDERIFQKECINGMAKVPEVVVLGSSRTMLINSTYFPEQSFFNNSVVGASIEDFIALFQVYKERNLLPQKIILGIDPWLLNENNGQARWKSLEYFYNNYHNKSNSKLVSPDTYKYNQLISFSYFQASVKALRETKTDYSVPVSTHEKYNETNTKLTDGSLVYGAEYRNASQFAINSKMRAYMQGDIYSIEHFETISNDIWLEFQAFVADLKKQNISVEFFLCPYPPLIFDKISGKYPNVMKTEYLIKNLATNDGIPIYGSFDPYILGFDETYFYDGMHCKEKGIERILNH